MTKQSGKKTDIQMVVEHVDDQLAKVVEHMDDQLAKVVESVKILHEISMQKMQHMSDKLEKVEADSTWTKLSLRTVQHDVKMLKLRSDKAADEYAGMKSEIKSHGKRITKLETA